MTSFPRGGAENTAPPRCFYRQKRNGFEAGKRETGKRKTGKRETGTKAERKNGGRKGKRKRSGSARGRRQKTAKHADNHGEKRKKRRRRPGGATGAAISAAHLLGARRHDLTRHPPGRTLSGAKNKKTPPQRGGVKNYLLLVNTGAVSRRGKHGASRDPAISHSRAPTGDQAALGR